MWKWITFFVLSAMSIGCAYFLSARGPNTTIREMYDVERIDLIAIILYAPFAFAGIAILDWWRRSNRKSK